MNKALLLLAALTLCCCIASLHASPGCRCLRTISRPVRAKMVQKIEVTPAAGHCRRTEIIITTWRGTVVCIDPKAPWLPELFVTVQRTNEMSDATALPAITSTADF